MKKNKTRSYPYVASLVTFVLFFAKCHATDIVMISGIGNSVISSSAPDYPIVYRLVIGDSSASSISLPNSDPAYLAPIAISPLTGNVLLGGKGENHNLPLAYSGSILDSSVKNISFPQGTSPGNIECIAFDSQGTAILAGVSSDKDINTPIAYRLYAGATETVPINLPKVSGGEIRDIAIFPDNTAILVGQNYDTATALIYVVPKDASDAIFIPIPDSSITGILNCVTITSDNLALMAGQNFSNNQALIYKLSSGSMEASTIPVPNIGDGSFINAIAPALDGTAIAGGGTAFLPIIYRISPGSDQVSTIANPEVEEGAIYDVAIGSNNVAILSGYTNNSPLIYRVPFGSSQATSISVPSSIFGILFSVAINSDNVAVLVGGSFDYTGLIYTLGPTDTIASSIACSSPFPEFYFFDLAIYSSGGLYDIKRVRPYYYNQIEKTKNVLKQAGL